MATDIYLKKPHRACGSTAAILDIVRKISELGRVLIISPTKQYTLKHFKINSSVVFASGDAAMESIKGCRFLAIVILDIDNDPNSFYTKLFYTEVYAHLNYITEYIFYEVLEDTTKGYRQNGNEIYNS